MNRRRRGSSGLFITFEGPDGSGKSVQSTLLVRWLRARGLPVVHTREPGGTGFAEKLRRILLDPKLQITPLAEVLFYMAARAQHTDEKIRPALLAGKIVVCERYADASVAYQGYGRRLGVQLVNYLNKIACNGLKPDITFLLDIDVKKGLRRLGRARRPDRLETEEVAFHERVRKGYLKLAVREPRRFQVIDTMSLKNQTHRRIIRLVKPFLKES